MRRVGLFEYIGIGQYLADLFPVRVDVANRSSLKPLVRATIERDEIHAFQPRVRLDYARSEVTTKRRPSAASAVSSCSRRTTW